MKFGKQFIVRTTVSLAALAAPSILLLAACGGGGGGTAASGGSTVSTFAGQYFASGADGTGPLANFQSPNAVVGDGQGNLYVADSGNQTIRKIVITTGATTTLAGQLGVAGAADGIGTAAQFNAPYGITTDGRALYVSDSNNNKIRRIAPPSGSLANMTSANAMVTSLTGTPGAVVTGGAVDGAAAAVHFFRPVGIATDGTNLYVVDMFNNKVREVVIATGYTTSLTGTSGAVEIAGAGDGAAASAQFNFPTGITTEGANLYVADNQNNKIRKIAPTTGATLATISSASAVVSSVTGAPNTSVMMGAADGAAASAQFDHPAGISTDGTSLYVADPRTNKVRMVSPTAGASLATISSASAVVSSFTGTANTAVLQGFADGAAASATFSYLQDVFTDGTNVYVADSGNNSIRQIVIVTGQVSTLAGAGIAADGVGMAARMDGPSNSTTDGVNLYVTDCGMNSLVRKVEIATGRVTTLAGQPGVTGAMDGLGTSAMFNCPRGIVTDRTNLYVVDSGNNKIRKLAPTGGVTLAAMTAATTMVTSLTGASGVVGLGGTADGAAVSAGFSSPVGITTDGTKLYVADQMSNRIRTVSPTGGATLATMTAASAMVSSLTGLPNASMMPGAVDGAAVSASFSGPQGITTDGARLYVVDGLNNKIRVIAPTAGATLATISAASAVVTSLTGAPSTAVAWSPADGPALTASFGTPVDITTDGRNLYVMDNDNSKVRMIAPATGATLSTMGATNAVVSSFTGTFNTTMPIGFADGKSASAMFRGPRGIITDGISLYVMDTGNGVVRKIH